MVGFGRRRASSKDRSFNFNCRSTAMGTGWYDGSFGSDVTSARGSVACPVEALEAWLAAASITTGPAANNLVVKS
jgi:hypothetical protein